MGITGRHFDLVTGHLVATLEGAGVGEEEINDVVALIGPLKDAIVTD